ncbi:MAG: cysteine desulfurase family protein [Phreatobacter sp.]|uniref:cysteine desulfurase family protein n=1 Tax=Phreatobacter sp. TaxID=1966341 RepID=UPI0027368BD9|nr:cysteine desulfurase family protein [Phreatobacter sp.]MDP2803872.1 cysteine desulfurase family protein [Phreatobacter sp.]
MTRVYLDHNATTPLRPEARAAMVAALDVTGNASAVHRDGRAARRIIEEARGAVAALVHGDPRCVTFTSGGSEAATTLLAADFVARDRERGGFQRLIVSAVEHSCVLAGGRYAPGAIAVCPVDAAGRVDLASLEALLAADGGRALVAVMAANNETGVIQPLAEIAALCRIHGAALVVDAVQALGKMPVDLTALGCDALFVSAHKIGGPQGVGAIVTASETVGFPPLVRGGGQEGRRRAGTENLAGIAGFGAAAAALSPGIAAEMQRLVALRDWLEREIITISGRSRVIGLPAERLPNTSLTIHPGLEGETAVIALDLAGIAVSTGSACASGKIAPSHVLAAMGLAATEARSALRVSLGWTTTRQDLERFVTAFAAHARTIAARAA